MTKNCFVLPLFSLLFLLLSPAIGEEEKVMTPESLQQSAWWSEVQEDIRQMEYAVTWQEESVIPNGKPGYHMANRNQNLRAYFYPDGLRIMQRVEAEPSWIFEYRLTGFCRKGSAAKLSEHTILPQKNCLEYSRGDLTESYENRSEGIKQTLTIQHSPFGTEPLVLETEISSEIEATVPENSSVADFRSNGHVVLRYGSLEARDVEGRLLPTRLSLADKRLRIEIEDTDAAYPVTVQSFFKGAEKNISYFTDTLLGANVADASYGYSVNTAGDINGDGFSDVIIGAPDFDGGQSGEGRGFVYYGSQTGVTTSDLWYAEINMVNANFGISVATAGDVNGDGFSDVLIGAIGIGFGGGAVYLWEGSESGLGVNGTLLNVDWQANNGQAASFFGSSVGTAGDVNGDGFSDIVIGAKEYRSGERAEGSVFVWYGSSKGIPGSPSTPANADWRYDGNRVNAYLGSSAGTAGDVNGDGYSDMIAGAPGYNNNRGRAYVFYGSGDGLDASTPDLIDSIEIDTQLGYSVGTAGDVNGDGFSDVIVGVPFTDTENPTTHATVVEGGQARVFHGSATGISSSPDQHLDGIDENGQLGYSVGTAGDVNGDGYADVIAGAPGVFRVGPNAGHAGVWLGSVNGILVDNDWSSSSFQTDARYGSSVATAGDVNGDGYSDIIVGAPGFNNDEIQGGRVAIYHGSASRVGENCEWSNGTGQQGSWYGSSVGTAGDVNGDGYADVIVGAHGYDGGQSNEGRVFVYQGGVSGLGIIPVWHAEADQANAQFGISAHTAGDVNGDGYTDVVVGAYWYDVDSTTNAGSAFIWYGSADGLGANGTPVNADVVIQTTQQGAWLGWSVGSAGDVNGDGYDDVLAGAPRYDQEGNDDGVVFLRLGAPADETITPAIIGLGQANAYFGTSAGTAGDVNGDNYADIIIGAPGYDNGETNEGGAFVYYGSATGPKTVPDWTAESNQANAQLGNSVGTAGDVNGDGYADIIIGAYLYDFLGGTFGGVDVGSAYIWYGGPPPLGLGPNGTPDNDDVWAGTLNPNSWCGWSVGTAGDVNGDGYADVIVGAPNEGISDDKEGCAYVYMGSSEGLASGEWAKSGDQASAYFGSSVGTAGDVNGDGCADIIIGAYQYDVGSSTNEGRAFLYYGNNGRAPSLHPRQRLSDDTGPVADHGWIDTTSILLALRGRTTFGRGLVRLEAEVKPFGTPFNAAGIQRTTEWMDTGTVGVELSQLIQGLAQNTYFHWRIRLIYHSAMVPFQPHSQWLTMPWNGWQEADFRTGTDTEPLYNRVVHFFGNGLGYFDTSGENLAPEDIIGSLEVFRGLEDDLLTRSEYLDVIR